MLSTIDFTKFRKLSLVLHEYSLTFSVDMNGQVVEYEVSFKANPDKPNSISVKKTVSEPDTDNEFWSDDEEYFNPHNGKYKA